jgi:thiol-disulfide isomerase/thioredoxin
MRPLAWLPIVFVACNADEPPPLAPVAPVVSAPLAVARPTPTLSVSLSVSAPASAAPSPAPVASSNADAGRPALVIHLTALDGSGTIDAGVLAGKVGAVVFWASFAEPCKKMLPRLQGLRAKYAQRGFEVVGVDEDEAQDAPQAKAFAARFGVRFPDGMDDGDRTTAHAWTPPTMPSVFVVDRAGAVRFTHAGWHDGEEAAVEREIQGLL